MCFFCQVINGILTIFFTNDWYVIIPVMMTPSRCPFFTPTAVIWHMLNSTVLMVTTIWLSTLPVCPLQRWIMPISVPPPLTFMTFVCQAQKKPTRSAKHGIHKIVLPWISWLRKHSTNSVTNHCGLFLFMYRGAQLYVPMIRVVPDPVDGWTRERKTLISVMLHHI